jgi:WD40 repeat protein
MLITVMRKQASRSPNLFEFIEDAKRFLRHCAGRISDAPLQVYPALVFCPDKSVIKKQFRDQVPAWIKKLPLVEPNPLLKLLRHTSSRPVGALAFSPQGGILASGGADARIALWDSDTGNLNLVIEAHEAVEALAFSPCGQILASVLRDGSVKLWNPIKGTLSRTLLETLGGAPGGRVCFSPDGKILASSAATTVTIWDLATERSHRSLAHSSPITAISFCLGGKLLASASWDGNILLWDCTTGSRYMSLENPHAVDHLAVPPMHTEIVVACGAERIRVWNLEQGCGSGASMSYTIKPGLASIIYAATFLPNGTLLALVHIDGQVQVQLWDGAVKTRFAVLGGRRRNWHTEADEIAAVVVSDNGGLLALGFHDGEVGLYAPIPQDGRPDYTSYGVSALALSPRCHMLASGSYRGVVKLWDLATGRCLASLTSHSSRIDAVAFSPDGQYLASASDNQIIIIGGLESHSVHVHHTLRGYSAGTTHVSFSPNGHLIASAGLESAVLLWDSATGALMHACTFESGAFSAVAFSPDSRLVAAAFSDGMLDKYRHKGSRRPYAIRVWEAATGQRILDFKGDGTANWLCFDPEGTYLQTDCDTFRFAEPFIFDQGNGPAPESSALYAVDYSVIYNGLPIMWLPVGSYTPFSVARNGLLPLIHECDQVVFIELDEEKLKALQPVNGMVGYLW